MKLIFRLDFPISYDLFDSSGKIIRILNEQFPGYWAQVGETRDARRVTGNTRDDDAGTIRLINVEPTAIHGSLEDRSGISFKEISECEYMEKCDATVTEVLRTFKVTDLTRLGLRLFCTDTYGDRFENPLRKFLNFTDREKTSEFEDEIGTLSDASFTFEGTSEDDVLFRISFGPGEKTDLQKVFNEIRVDELEESTHLSHHLIADIDMYERDFSFAGNSLKRWARSKWRLAENFLDLCARHMIEGKG